MIRRFWIFMCLGFAGLIGYIQYCQYNAIKDLDFVYQQLCDNHPGFYNEQDVEFKNILQQGYQETRETILSLYWWQDHVPALQKYVQKFDDNHLRIFEANVTLNTDSEDKSSIFIKTLSKKAIMVNIPTFWPNPRQGDEFKIVFQQLSEKQDLEYVVFDLRHNDGGNSSLGTELLQALFGKKWVDAQLYTLYKKQKAWWRASPDNSKHLHELVSHFSKNKELNKNILQFLTTVDRGIEKALKENQVFYIENECEYKKPLHKASNPVKAKIIVIIDNNNNCASLDFITELKALTKNILFIGHETDADTVYTEVRWVRLPSKKATLQYPIKMYHNRARRNKESYFPDIMCAEEEITDKWVFDTIDNIIERRI